MQSYDVNKVCYIFWGKQFDVNSILEDSSIGFISEVYLEYSDELHYPHNDYPLAPGKLNFLMICGQIIVK